MALLDYLDLASPGSLVDAPRRWALLGTVRSHTLVSKSKLSRLYSLARRIERNAIPGAIVECGVYKGGSAALLAAASRRSRPVWLFDSFKGLPPPGEKDGVQAHELFHEGWCGSTLDDVREIMDRVGIDRDRVHAVEGWFEETLPERAPETIALLHIDADWYDSVKTCLDRLYDRVAPGGFVVWDDYGRWEGCTRAVDEFLEAQDLSRALERAHFIRKPVRAGAGRL